MLIVTFKNVDIMSYRVAASVGMKMTFSLQKIYTELKERIFIPNAIYILLKDMHINLIKTRSLTNIGQVSHAH